MASISPQALAKAKQYLKEHFPYMEGGEISVSARDTNAPSPEILTKLFDTPSPSWLQKPAGSKETSPRLHVVTSRKMFQAEDGTPITRIARITVDEDGNVVKATVSK
jgi:hypothetical protein